jgi:site-specific DNA-methyltransferase (adenine-specific)
MKLSILQGNTLEILPTLPAESIDLCTTSPPYWGLRNYNAGASELGAEPTMEAYLDNTMKWVKEVWRVLKPTGSFVLNIGDCFVSGSKNATDEKVSDFSCMKDHVKNQKRLVVENMGGIYKTKQLLSVSSFAYCRIVSETDFVCRGEHIWAKPNVPSPIRSRLKHSHEKLFWFVKDADRYYFDSKAWMTKIKNQSKERNERNTFVDGAHADNIGLSASSCYRSGQGKKYLKQEETIEHSWRIVPVGAKQSGFELEGKQASEHIAPYPENLIRPYIQSLCPYDGTTLDPFLGSGTTMRVAMEEGRNAIGCELNEKSISYAKKRLNWGQGLGVEYI